MRKIILSLHPATLSKENSKWIIMKEALPPKIPRFLFDAFVKFFIKSLCNLSHKIIADTFSQKSGLIEFYKVNIEKIHVAPLIFPPNNVKISIEKKKKFRKERGNKAEKWTTEEHKQFLNAVRLHGKNWTKVADMIPTRDRAAIASHS